MASERVKRAIREGLLRSGVQIDGDRPFDLRVKDDAFYDAVHKDGLSGARDAYVDGLWDTAQLDELTCRLLRAAVAVPYASRPRLWLGQLAGWLTNQQQGRRGLRIRRHYDLGNDLFAAMLDPLMTYSCGYWREATSLAEAQ
jgi:cyclopropane-fatty-acyl-phospholipid synthase